MLLAGLDGIKNNLEIYEAAREPLNEDLFELTLDEIKQRGIRTLPATLREAIYAVEDELKDPNSFLKPVMTDEFIKTYIDYKYETEIIPVEGRPHPYEFITSYSC
jgi:glutamine synthetase